MTGDARNGTLCGEDEGDDETMETEHLPEEEHHDQAHEQPRLWAGTLSTNDRARYQTFQHHPQTGAQLEENPWVRRGIT